MVTPFGPNLSLLEKIASGGMGDVYRARQSGVGGFQKTVAVKRIRPQFAARKEFAEMFSYEMSLCSRLQHPNIVQVFTSGEESGYLFLVMEYIRGVTVGEILKKCKERGVRIPPELSCFIISEVALGLAYAHGLSDDETGTPLQIVHRDVSPQNIMLGFGGEVKILDFGIAKAADKVEGTRVGDLKGKASYAAPEYIDGQHFDRRADIFALGVVLYEMLTQDSLFTGENTIQTLDNVMQKEIPSLVEHFSDIRFELEGIALRSLERDPELRFQNADDLYKALAVFMNRVYPQFTRATAVQFLKDLFDEIVDSPPPLSEENEPTGGSSAPPPENPEPIPEEITDTSFSWSYAILSGALLMSAVGLIVAGYFILTSRRVEHAVRPTDIPGLFTYLRSEGLGESESVERWGDTSWLKMVFRPLISQQIPQRSPGDQTVRSVRFERAGEALHAPELAGPMARIQELSVAYVGRVVSAARTSSSLVPLWTLTSGESVILSQGLYGERAVGIRTLLSRGPYERRGAIAGGVGRLSMMMTIVDQKSIKLFSNGALILDERTAEPVHFDRVRDIILGPGALATEGSASIALDLTEFIIYGKALSDKERHSLEGYFASKFGVAIEAE